MSASSWYQIAYRVLFCTPAISVDVLLVTLDRDHSEEDLNVIWCSKSRQNTWCFCERQSYQGDMLLKSHIATGIKGLTPFPYSEDERTTSHFTTSSMQHKFELFKNLVLSCPNQDIFIFFRSSWFHNIYNTGHHKGNKYILMESKSSHCFVPMLKVLCQLSVMFLKTWI